MSRLFLLVPLFLACPVAAQDGPSFDCSRAGSTVETLICADPALAALDRAVAAQYAAAQDAVASDPAGLDTLRAVQRGWIKGRDDCWKAADLRACVEQSYLMREGELVALYLLDEASAVVTWTCDGNLANEVVTWFFETTLPSVRFERGDSVDAGHVAISGSGARYEGSFGREIWIKGDEALYTEPDGTQLSCVANG
ncbi:lysozyme inhibitor LprI family protein [Tropicibacter sp. S64]|uniref:lysozyme inhibitor LprI family protein n=1 Tax=Tropicibacter sp. S64 TaxID=3415122 RepID=UPI003C7A35D7